MANETYIKPSGVALGAISLQKVDEISVDEQAGGEALYGDAAVWPTANKSHQRNARITITTRDHAGWDALLINTKGTLAFSFHDEDGGVVAKSWPNLIVKNRSGRWGGKPQAGQIVFEVEDATGLAGPWS
jgi:hypothetical protein